MNPETQKEKADRRTAREVLLAPIAAGLKHPAYASSVAAAGWHVGQGLLAIGYALFDLADALQNNRDNV